MKTGILNRVPLKNSFIFQNQNGEVINRKEAKDIKALIVKIRFNNEFPLSFDKFITSFPKILERNLKTANKDLTEEEQKKLKNFNYAKGVMVVEIRIARRASFRKTSEYNKLKQEKTEERSL